MEMTMKTVKLFFKTTCLFTAAILTGCTADVAQEEEKNKEPNPAATNITFTSENPSTRTSITHSIGNGATPFWSTGDRIWVKNVSNQWQQSSEGTFSSDMSNGVFTFSSGTFKDNCEVHYTGVNGKADKVTIANKQTQSNPNDFSHAGVSGDCGMGVAKGNGERFKFKLSHKSSYICFLPQSSNEKLVKDGKLIKIEVISKDNIAGTFDFSNGVLSPTRTRTTDSDKKITLITGDGFSIDKSTNIDKNGSYIVIAPGNHELTIRYWLRYKTYKEDVTGTITKTFKLNCEAGKIYDIKAKLDPTDYSYKKYYMWDCAIGQDYWKGNEQYQPKTKNAVDYSHYPKSVTDPRWYNEKTAFPAKAYRSCDGCPNVNETWWFIQNGDPHWDSEELWVMYDHLYTGGMWFKKKNYISGFNSSHAPNGTDYTTNAVSASHAETATYGRPDDFEKYFYLPALGGYDNGRFYNIGEVGNYWTCTPTPLNNSPGVVTRGAYYLYFYIDNKDPKKVTASIYGGENRYKGFTWWEKK